MAGFRNFSKAGHAPTPGIAFFFASSCSIWVINGAIAPFSPETCKSVRTEKGAVLPVPIFAGALMRFAPSVLAPCIGSKNPTMVEMGLIMVAPALAQRFGTFDRCE